MEEGAQIPLCRICPTASRVDRSSERFKELQRTFPPGYKYIICELATGEGQPYRASFRLRISSEKEARAWIKQYQDLSRTTWRTKCSHATSGRKMIARVEKMCHHNTRTKQTTENRRTKNTDCPASLDIRIRRLISLSKYKSKFYTRSKDPHMTDWPASLTLVHDHNHSLDDPSILSHRDVSPSVKKKFIDLYKDGMSVKEALAQHKQDLSKEHGERYNEIILDRHFCPDIQYCYRLYYDIFRKDTKSLSKRKVQQLTEDRITKYNDENGPCIKSETLEGEDVVAIVTPLMKRVHSMLPIAGKVVFMNSHCSGPRRPQLFILMAESFIGGLPLGCFITNLDSSAAIQKGLEMLHQLVGNTAFFGRGPQGPELFLTTNSEAERTALRTTFPTAKLVLNIFHVLQSFWQFVFREENKILESDRSYLFQLMKTLIYCASEIEIQMKFTDITADPVVLRYPNVVSHFKDIYGRRAFWTTFHLDWEGLTVDASSCEQNFCDSAMKVLKDRPFEKLRSANTFQLLDLVLSGVDDKCMTRLLDLSEGKVQKALVGRYGNVHALCAFKREEIYEGSPMVYTMPITKKKSGKIVKLVIDMNVGFCTCPAGISGGPCKHQYVLIKYFDIKIWRFDLITDPQWKQWLTTVAQGDLANDLDMLSTRLKEAVQRDPVQFTKPLQVFIHRWMQFMTDADLRGAMVTFNKSTAHEQRKRKNEDGGLEGGGPDKKPKTGEKGGDDDDDGSSSTEEVVQDITNRPKTLKRSPRKQNKNPVTGSTKTPTAADAPSNTAKTKATPQQGNVSLDSQAKELAQRPSNPTVHVLSVPPAITQTATPGIQQPNTLLGPHAVQVLKVQQKNTQFQIIPSSQAGVPVQVLRASQGGMPIQVFTVTQGRAPVQVVPITQPGASIQIVPAPQSGAKVQAHPAPQTGGSGSTNTESGDAVPAPQASAIQVLPLSQMGTAATAVQVLTIPQAQTSATNANIPQAFATAMQGGNTSQDVLKTQENAINQDLGSALGTSQTDFTQDEAIEVMTSMQESLQESIENINASGSDPSTTQSDASVAQGGTSMAQGSSNLVQGGPGMAQGHTTMAQGGLSGLADMADQVEKLMSAQSAVVVQEDVGIPNSNNLTSL